MNDDQQTELFEAAKAFYNATVGNPNVEISSSTREQRDAVDAAGNRLRAILLELKAAHANNNIPIR